MHLQPLPQNTRELLEFLRNVQNTGPQELISLYTQSLSILTDDIHSLFIFLDYMNLAMNFLELDEIEHLYTLFKVKLRKYKIFWVSYLKFEIEDRKKDFESSFGRIMDYLKFKAFEGKDEVVGAMVGEKEALRAQYSCTSVPEVKDNETVAKQDTPTCKSVEEHAVGTGSARIKQEDKEETVEMATEELLSSNIFTDTRLNASPECEIPAPQTTGATEPTISNIMSTPSCVKTSSETKNEEQDRKDGVLFELELSRTQDTGKLRFSPKKRIPYRDEAIQSKGSKFIDIFTAQKEADEMAVSTVQFKNKELLLLSKIGKGGYSTVYRVSQNGEVYALKKIRTDDQEGQGMCMDEIVLLKKLDNCEFVIRMIDYEIKSDGFNILLEYGEIDLQNLIKSGPLNKFYIKYLWESILRILIFIHANRIVHRDIKPANFVLVRGKLKIIDFGISKSIKGDTTSILNFEKTGTLNYISPEQCSGRKVSRASDVWAAGCILYFMIYRKNVHGGRTVMDVLRLMTEEAEIEYGEAEEAAIESIKACLVYDPKARAKPESLLNYRFLCG